MLTTLRRAAPAMAVLALIASAGAIPADAATGQAHAAAGQARATGLAEHGRTLSLLAVRSVQATAVPADFQPESASFLSPATGFVLGTEGCTPHHACLARLATTTDGGARWNFLNVPDVRLPDPSGQFRTSRVSGVTFASRRVGWLYGPALWVTRDGGPHWRKLSFSRDTVAVTASSGTAYAVVEPHPYDAKPWELFSRPASHGRWARVAGLTGDPQATFAASGRAAWFDSGTRLWATRDAGARWHQYPLRCPGAFYGLTSIAAASASRVVFLCTNSADFNTASEGIEILRSTDGGRTVQLTGRKAPIGDGGVIAVPPHHSKVITFATSVGSPSWLGRSANGGKTLKQVASFADGFSWNSLSYVSRTTGWIVLGAPALGGVTQLLQTSDAGRSWHAVGF